MIERLLPTIDDPYHSDLNKQIHEELAREANKAEQDLYPKLNRKTRRAEAKILRRKPK